MFSLEPDKRSGGDVSPWKRVRRALVVLVVGFLAFAPPGTLIVGALLLASLFGKVWVIVAGIVGVIALVGSFLVHRKYNKRLNQ